MERYYNDTATYNHLPYKMLTQNNTVHIKAVRSYFDYHMLEKINQLDLKIIEIQNLPELDLVVSIKEDKT